MLFVTLSHMIGLSSICLQKTWNTFTLSNIYILMHNNTFAADFFWKHEISTVSLTRTSKNSKIHDFFDFLVLSLYCFLIVKSCVQHVFAGFRAIWCRKHTVFDDLELKKAVFQLFYQKICTLLFVTLSYMIELSSIFLQKT